MKNIKIRKICEDDMHIALNLVWDVFLEYEAPDYSNEGIDEFNKSIHDKQFLSRLCIYGAYMGSELAGVIATRSSGTHIALFFVKGKYHRKGIGKILLDKVIENKNLKKITVNSSPYAIAIYHKLGFQDTNKEQITNGLKYTPMERILS